MKLRVVFITHIHGDHQLGIIKIMSERDKLIDAQGGVVDPENKLYIVAPIVMMDYLNSVKKIALKYPEMVVFVNSNDLNPEKEYYYQENDQPRNPKKQGGLF